MIGIILLSIAFFILVIGTFTDFKTREVPDWVNYSAVCAGLGIRFLYSAYTFDWSYIIAGIFGFVVFLGLALAMFYLGQWGGGDSKMLMGIGALLGLEIRPDNLLVAFLLNALIVGAVYGLLWGIYLAIKNRKKFCPYLAKLLKTERYKKIKTAVLAGVIVLVIMSFAFDFYIAILLITMALVVLVMFFSWVFLTAVEKTSLVKFIPIEKLTEGDWIVKDVVVDKKRICGPKDLGISKAQIRKLANLKQKGKIRKVLIKEGMPFVPVFLISMIISVIWGNIVLLFI